MQAGVSSAATIIIIKSNTSIFPRKRFHFRRFYTNSFSFKALMVQSYLDKALDSLHWTAHFVKHGHRALSVTA